MARRAGPNSRPSLADFRYDNFLAFVPEFSCDYAPIVRHVCLREGGFKPVGNTLGSVLSMVAAGRGVFLRPLIGVGDYPPTINCYVLDEVRTKWESPKRRPIKDFVRMAPQKAARVRRAAASDHEVVKGLSPAF